MKFWNMLGTVSRYVLAAVSCISLAQFLLLLNVGTENAGRLAGQSLGRGVISGIVAAVWFYRARKVRPPTPANAQTQVRVTPPPKSQAQPAVPPMDSVPSTSPASVLTADHSGSSFEQKELKAVIVVVVVAIVLFILVGTGMFHQPWTLSAGASQPRFIHVQGAPAWKMFDNKTGQDCNTGAVVYDSVDQVREDFHEALQRNTGNEECVDSLDSTDASKRYWCSVGYEEFYKRYDALKANPNNPTVYHYHGMPYCSELAKKWW